MSDAPCYHHISSAVVSVLPAMTGAVLAQLSAIPGIEVHGHHGGKIVIVVEGGSTGAMGDHLARIALLDGVIAANMVFEHIEAEEVIGQVTGADFRAEGVCGRARS